MKVFALTGGIASGKSTACGQLRELVPSVQVFEADECVARLLDSDPLVQAAIVSKFGEACRTSEGVPDRGWLRQRVFDDPAARQQLEAILHPRVLEECLESKRSASTLAAPWFVADIPLLFETGFDFGQELSLVVATSRETQLSRLKKRSGFDDALCRSILASQMPVEAKMDRADVVFWNEGPPACLEAQLVRFAKLNAIS